MADTSWSVRRLLARLTRRTSTTLECPRCAIRRKTAASGTSWSVRPMSECCGRPSGKAVIAGPGLVALAQDLLTDLAFSILDGDGRAEAWGEYLTALANAKTAKDDGEPLGAHLDAVADAWDGLTPELGCDLYLPLLDALRLGRQLERVAGEALAEIGRRAA